MPTFHGTIKTVKEKLLVAPFLIIWETIWRQHHNFSLRDHRSSHLSLNYSAFDELFIFIPALIFSCCQVSYENIIFFHQPTQQEQNYCILSCTYENKNSNFKWYSVHFCQMTETNMLNYSLISMSYWLIWFVLIFTL